MIKANCVDNNVNWGQHEMSNDILLAPFHWTRKETYTAIAYRNVINKDDIGDAGVWVWCELSKQQHVLCSILGQVGQIIHLGAAPRVADQ